MIRKTKRFTVTLDLRKHVDFDMLYLYTVIWMVK